MRWTAFCMAGLAGAIVVGCLEGPADYSGPDDPTKDYDNDGSVVRPSDGSAPDCAENDPTRFPEAPEFCDGRWNACESKDGWTPSDELGAVTFYDLTGRPADLTPEWAAGTDMQPAAVTLDEEGTVVVCGGTWYVDLTIATGGMSIRGQTVADEPTVLSGGGNSPIMRVDATGRAIILEDLSFIEGQGTESRPAGGLQIDQGTVALRRARFTDMVGPAGASITVASRLDLDSVTVERSYASETHGGGVLVEEGAHLTADGFSCSDCTTVMRPLAADEPSYGGAIAVFGAADLTRLTLQDGAALFGGGIYNAGRLTLEDAFIRGFTCASGGALYNDEGGVAVVERSIFTEHDAPFDQDGAAVTNGGELSLLQTTIINNWASGIAGGIYNLSTGDLYAEEVAVTGNFAQRGGNVYDSGVSHWKDSIIRGGVAVYGGGLYINDGADVFLEDTAVWFNHTRQDGDEGRAGLEGGGAVAVSGGSLTCEASSPFVNSFIDSDAGARQVFTGNTGNSQWVGGIMLYDGPGTNLELLDCGFGGGDDANRSVALAVAATETAYDVDDFTGEVACSNTGCTCNGENCPEATLPP